MCENVKLSCACDQGYSKGVLKKTLENNIFSIFGNITKNNSIVIRYHGELTTNVDQNSVFDIAYFFDSNDQDIQTVPLYKCTKCIGDSYCVTIDLEKFSNLHFCFKDEKNNYEKNQDKMFCLNIAEDPIESIMQRYGFEKNENLPVSTITTYSELNHIKTLMQKIKSFLSSFLYKKSNI